MRACWLRQFAPAQFDACAGPIQLCHVGPSKQLLKRRWDEAHNARSVRPRPELLPVLPPTLEELLWDPRLVRPGCERHHRLFDELMAFAVELDGETRSFMDALDV